MSEGRLSAIISDADQQTNRRKSAVRAKVEHPFLTLMRLWGFAGARYRGLAFALPRALSRTLALLCARVLHVRVHRVPKR